MTIALFLPDGFEVTLKHCGVPMVDSRSRISWEGKHRQGFEITENSYLCAKACGAELVLKAREPA